ncbi:hypothetical protein [Ochrobactrum sp. MYb379]|uniref:hypothetical protein n=1 Tax=Ochrobactrum sp. MYb379 TaxID=2745275 RepID=UPI0030B13BC9
MNEKNQINWNKPIPEIWLQRTSSIFSIAGLFFAFSTLAGFPLPFWVAVIGMACAILGIISQIAWLVDKYSVVSFIVISILVGFFIFMVSVFFPPSAII